MIESLPPGMLLMLGALLVPFVPRRVGQAWMLLLPVLGLMQLASLPETLSLTTQLGGYTLEYVRVDRLSFIFGVVFHIAALIGVLYALHVDDWVQHVAGLVYAGSAIAAAFAGDLITLFVYWELTAISSVFLIWAQRTEKAFKVGIRYLIIQVGSGVLLLAGAIVRFSETGSLDFTKMELGGPGTYLIFLAFGIKAAFPFLHNWLQDAYPEATVTGAVFLASFTTKLAVYSLARGFPGTEILIYIGAAMTAFPIFFAVIENDLRRVLAYSLNNQLGFMLVGVGIGTELALNGTAAHAFAHILYKALLFMAMGAVLHRTGTVKASELGGLYKSMPITAVLCIVGSISISAMPFTSGFVSKSMIMTAAADGHLVMVSLVLLFASAGVCDHSGIKIPFFAFFAHDSGRRVEEAPMNMLVAMGIAAMFCIGMGVYPQFLYAMLPYAVDYVPYTTSHVVSQLRLLTFARLAFAVMRRMGIYPPELRSTNLDTDVIYRKGLPWVYREITDLLSLISNGLKEVFFEALDLLLAELRRLNSPRGLLGEPWSTGVGTMWVGLMLAAYLLMEFLG